MKRVLVLIDVREIDSAVVKINRCLRSL